MPVVPLLILAVVLLGLFLTLVIVQGRYLNLLADRQAEARAWMLGQDPDYWRERMGRGDGAPYINDGPEAPGTPPFCDDIGSLHVADGNACKNCPADLTPVRTV